MQALTSAQVFLFGGVALTLLLTGYALLEWALALLRRVGQAGQTHNRLFWLFALPATLVGLTPCIVVSAVLRLNRDTPLFGDNSFAELFSLFAALMLGLVLDLIAMLLFKHYLKKAEAQVQAKTL